MQVKCLCVVTRRDLLLVCGRVYCPAVRTKKTPLMDKISIAWVTCGIPWWNTTCTGTDTVYLYADHELSYGVSLIHCKFETGAKSHCRISQGFPDSMTVDH